MCGFEFYLAFYWLNHSTPSIPSGEWWTHIRQKKTLHYIYSSVHFNIQPHYCMALNSQAVSEALNSTCSWTIFSSLFSLLPFVILSCCTQAPSEVQWSSDSIYQSKAMVSTKGSESFTWIREFLMTRLTSSLHSATPGLWSSRFDEKASR